MSLQIVNQRNTVTLVTVVTGPGCGVVTLERAEDGNTANTTQPTLTTLTTWTSFPFPDLVTWWLPTHCHCTVYTNNIYRGFMSLLQLVDLTWQYQHPTVWVSRRSCSCHSCVGSRGFKWFSYHKPAFLWQLPSTWYLEVKLAITLEFDIVCLKKHHKYGLISAFNGKTGKHEKHISMWVL